jgi:hypothetical protein
MEEEEHVECTPAGASVEEGDVAQEEEGSDGMEEEEHVDSRAINIHKVCSVYDSGYAALKDVNSGQQNNRMESFFPSETLKYLCLLQSKDDKKLDLLNTVS